MKKLSLSSIAAHPTLATLICTTAGCVQDPGRPAQTLATDVDEETSSTLIASIELEPGHVVRFYDAEAGLVATESGEGERHSPVLAGLEIDSFVEVFKVLVPDQPIPTALLAADARWTAQRAQVSNSSPLADNLGANSDGANSDGPSLYTTPEQTWFRQTFCQVGTPKCIQGWDWIEGGSDYTNDWRATAMVGSEGRVAAPHSAFWWKCSSGSCWWEPLLSANVSPGRYHWITGGGGHFHFRSTLTGAGGSTQVSMAITAGPYQCVSCNDSTCQCGYNTPENMCAAHGGPQIVNTCTIRPL
jgi:hypothetical protein